MAINVYLVFFRRYDAHMLRRLYWIYGGICYGLPFIPAMFCLFYRNSKKGKMYGNATVSPLSRKRTEDLFLTSHAALVLDIQRLGRSANLLVLRSNMGSHPPRPVDLHPRRCRNIP
jgi:hypothetical protein